MQFGVLSVGDVTPEITARDPRSDPHAVSVPFEQLRAG